MQWTEPSEENPALTLPKIGPINTPILPASCTLSIPVDDVFLEAWTNGPRSSTPQDIHDSLHTLVSTFATLAHRVKSDVTAQTKDHATDYVTETDQGVEMLFRLWLNRHLPEQKIIGEEGGQDPISANDVVWYIDPIDGTANYVETPLENHPMVSMHFGSTYQGKPYINIVAFPFHKTLYSQYTGQPASELALTPVFKADTTTRIGSEFSGTREHNAVFLDQLCKSLSAEKARYRAIGVNLIALLEGHVTAFYKDATKLWDVMAPLGILKQYRPDLAIECLYNPTNDPITPDVAKPICPFSHDADWVAHLNKRHHFGDKSDKRFCRAGIILVYPKDQPTLKDAMLQTIWDSKAAAK